MPLAASDVIGAWMVLIAIAGFWIVTAWVIADYARKRGHSFAGFMALGILVSPVISGVLVLILSDRAAAASSQQLDDLSKLAQLRDSGILTDREFEQKKAEMLSTSTP